jgi:hypothetical protein
MAGDDLLGPVEIAVIDALHRGALRSRCSAVQIAGLRDEPAGDYVLHTILGRLEEQGLVWTRRDASSRHWMLTPAGRARLRRRRQFARTLATLIVRSQPSVD